MTLGGSPKRHPKMPNRLPFGLFFRALPYSPPSLNTLFQLSHFILPHPFPKEVNKKRSNRGQHALSVIKTDERDNDSQQ